MNSFTEMSIQNLTQKIKEKKIFLGGTTGYENPRLCENNGTVVHLP